MRPHETDKLLYGKRCHQSDKWQPTEWRKYFSNYISDRALISKIHIELKPQDIKERTQFKTGYRSKQFSNVSFHVRKEGWIFLWLYSWEGSGRS